MKSTDTKMIELVEAIYVLRSAGWTVEPPAEKRGTTGRRTSKAVGRPPKKRVGRPPKKRVGRLPKKRVGRSPKKRVGRPPKKSVGRPPKKRVGRPPKEIASSNQASQGSVQSVVVGQ
jgi:hypothetical protein